MESQGHTLNLVSNLDDFFLVGGTKAPTTPTVPPTSFPTFPADWYCDQLDYGDGNICHCGCRAPDPDCDIEQSESPAGCLNGQICAEGECVGDAIVPNE